MREGELRRVLKTAAAIVEGLEGRGMARRGARAGRSAEGSPTTGVQERKSVKEISITESALAHEFPGRSEHSERGGNGRQPSYTSLPPAETIPAGYAGTTPGLRMALPDDGVLGECLRRYGLVPAWPDVQRRLLPEHLPDDVALKAVQDAERAEMKRLRQELPTAAYRVPGRRGPPVRGRLRRAGPN